MQLLDLLVVAGLSALVQSRSCDAATSSNVTYTDVLILGAGMSGVAAARTLFVKGIKDFIILEAGDKVGGRMRFDEKRNIELGANWIHGLDLFNRTLHPLWREWVKCDDDGPDGSVTPDFENVYDETGNPYDIRDNKSYRLSEIAFKKAVLKAGNISDHTADEYISVRGALSESNWTLQNSIDKLIEWVIVDYYFGVAPEELGLVHSYPDDALVAFLERDEKGVAKREYVDYLISDDKGFSYVVKCLARDFMNTSRLKLKTRVTKVETLDDFVCVTVNDGSRYCALYAILTFSMGVLQAAIHGEKDAVHFKPDLPQHVKGYINQVTMVDYIPIFLIFNESFWNETIEQQVIGYASELKGYYPLFFTVKNVNNTLFVHVTGDLARRVVRQNKYATSNEIMTILRKIYNESIPDPIDIVVTNWSIDPLFMGAYEAYGPGVPENIVEELLKPINSRLYFAGSALNTSHYGFTHGAYSSGVNVAKRVAEALNAEKNGSVGEHPSVYVTVPAILSMMLTVFWKV